jgi:hypothetical protein
MQCARCECVPRAQSHSYRQQHPPATAQQGAMVSISQRKIHGIVRACGQQHRFLSRLSFTQSREDKFPPVLRKGNPKRKKWKALQLLSHTRSRD